ncbi:hypothetical protein EX30DRAFT_387349, partial [Ascodesmis nigricans]
RTIQQERVRHLLSIGRNFHQKDPLHSPLGHPAVPLLHITTTLRLLLYQPHPAPASTLHPGVSPHQSLTMAETNQFLHPTKPNYPLKGHLIFWTLLKRSSSSSSDPARTVYKSHQRGPVYKHDLISPPCESQLPQPSPIEVSEHSRHVVHFTEEYIEPVEIDILDPGVITIRVIPLFTRPQRPTPYSSPISPPLSEHAEEPQTTPEGAPEAEIVSTDSDSQAPPQPQQSPTPTSQAATHTRYILTSPSGRLLVGTNPQAFKVAMVNGRQVLHADHGGLETVWTDKGQRGWFLGGGGETLYCRLFAREEMRGLRYGYRAEWEWEWCEEVEVGV